MLAKRPPLSLFQVQTFGGTYSAGSVTGASVISLAPGFFRPCSWLRLWWSAARRNYLCLLYRPCRVPPQGTSHVRTIRCGGRRNLHVTVSHQHRNKTKSGLTSGEECTMLRSKWLTPFFGMMLAIVCGGHASAQADHQGRLHRSAFRTVRASRRRQPEADAVHHRLHQRQGRRARQEVRTGSVRQQVAAVGRADRAQERHRPEHALHHAVQRLQHRRRPDRRRQQAQRPQPGQPHHLSELRRGGHRADQRAVQLLAFPLRPARRHEGRGDGPRAAEGRPRRST